MRILCSAVRILAAIPLALAAAADDDPGSFGIDPKGLSTLEKHFAAQVEGHVRSGYAILIGQGDEIVFERYLGKADIENGTAVGPDTKYRLASMTKPIVSLAVMQLYEQGKLRLVDPIDLYLPEFKDAQVVTGRTDAGDLVLEKANRLVTITDLLTHTGGIGSRLPSHNPIAAQLYQEAVPAYFGQGDYASKIKLLADTPLWFQPGEVWGYGIYSTDVLGRIVEVVSQMTLDQYVKEHILDPLGMSNTGFLLRGRLPDGLAAMYTHTSDGQLQRVDTHPLDMLTAPHGGGGMYSTPRDYFKFLSMILRGGVAADARVVSQSSIDMMTRNALPTPLLPINLGIPIHSGGFGLGFGVATDQAPLPHSPLANGDFWWGGSSEPYFFASPAHNTIGVIMSQIQPAPQVTTWRTWDEFAALAYAAICTRYDTQSRGGSNTAACE